MNAQTTAAMPSSSDRVVSISLEDAIALIKVPQELQGPCRENQTRVGTEPQTVPPASLTAVVDVQALQARCLGNMDLVLRVINKFRTTGDTDLQQIEAAIEQSDFVTIARISHRFSGASGNISAARLRLMASYVEQLAREQNLTEIRGAFAQARGEWKLFVQFAAGIAPRNTPKTPVA